MTPRKIAASTGLPTYSTGKPCKYGHMSNRYASSGACIACLKDNAKELKVQTRQARIAHNTNMLQGIQPYTVYVKESYRPAVSAYCDVLRHGTPEAIAQCDAFITMMKEAK